MPQKGYFGLFWAYAALLKNTLIWHILGMPEALSSSILGLWGCRTRQNVRKGLLFQIKSILVQNIHFRRSYDHNSEKSHGGFPLGEGALIYALVKIPTFL